MIRTTLIFSIFLITSISGCAYYFPLSQEDRITQYKVSCELMGFKKDSIEYSKCILELEKSYLSGRGTSSISSNSMSNDAKTQQMIDNDRTRRQILNHGAGGCTPNFSTGGCL